MFHLAHNVRLPGAVEEGLCHWVADAYLSEMGAAEKNDSDRELNAFFRWALAADAAPLVAQGFSQASACIAQRGFPAVFEHVSRHHCFPPL